MTTRNKSLKELQDIMSKETFGISKSEAHSTGICIQCRQPAVPNCYSAAGRREYAISGLCEKCFDEITGSKHI